ncbi:MAG: NAD-dependent epimerase/dehydratase family protein [Magnetococcales bacterium]|nr:NAD-dependent epimerase/dehydratase family protein [Magnetococcales bacterium]
MKNSKLQPSSNKKQSSMLSLVQNDLDLIVEQVGGLWEDFRDGRVFLTGGTAFFGVWILASLQAANKAHGLACQVVVLSRNPNAFLAKFPEFNDDPMISFVTGDVRNFIYPKGDFTHVIHGAVETRKGGAPSAIALLDVLSNGTQRVLEFAGQSGVKKFLFLSSGAVYGAIAQDSEGVDENEPSNLLPQDINATLGVGKFSAEHLCAQFAKLHDIDIKIARCFTFVGPFMPMQGKLAIGNFIADAINKNTIQINSDGASIRSYMYVTELMVWLWNILVRHNSPLPINVGSNTKISIKDLAILTSNIVAPQKNIAVKCKETKSKFRSTYLPSIKRAEEQLGLVDNTNLNAAISKTADWYEKWFILYESQQKESLEIKKAAFKPKIFVCDIDGVVARLTSENDYSKSSPNVKMIAAINALYDAGHSIIMFTARGTVTGINWQDVTQNQLQSWGLRYHELHFGKPAADYYVDDRMISIAALTEMSNLDNL